MARKTGAHQARSRPAVPARPARTPAELTDPAEFCPADSRIYLLANRLSDWDEAEGYGWIMGHARWLLRPACPKEVWERAKRRLGKDGYELLNTYFGHMAALVVPRPSRKPGSVLVSRARPEDLNRAPDAFGMTAHRIDGVPRSFVTYSIENGDRDLRVAIAAPWLLVCEQRHESLLRRVMKTAVGGSPNGTLADVPAFRDLPAKLPSPNAGMLFVRERRGPVFHAGVLIREKDDLVVHYAATNRVPPQTSQQDPSSRDDDRAPPEPGYPHLRRSRGVDFGPLPDTVIGAAALNIVHYAPKDLGILDLPMVFGSVRAQILPNVRPPVLGFLGAVKLEQIGSDQQIVAPAAGAAIKLADLSAAEGLDRIVRTLHMLATLGRLDVGHAFFGVDVVEEQGVPFKVADFGWALVRWIKDPAVAAVANLPEPAGLRRIAYGRIGDWYVVCSQETLFRQCVRAHLGDAPRLKDSDRFREFAVADKPELLLTGVVHSGQLAELASAVARQLTEGQKPAPRPSRPRGKPRPEPPFKRLNNGLNDAARAFRTVSRDWRYVHTCPTTPAVAKPIEGISTSSKPKPKSASPPKTNPTRALKPLRWASDVLKQRHTFSLQIWRGPDARPRGLLRLVDVRDRVAESGADSE